MDDNQNPEEQEGLRPAAIPFGAVIGVAVAVGVSTGVALHNAGVGLGIGIGIAAAMVLFSQWGERARRRRR